MRACLEQRTFHSTDNNMSLLELPLDILLLVTGLVGVHLYPYITIRHEIAYFSQITNKTDLKHLSEVCKYLYYHVTPILYKSVTVDADNELRMHEIVASLLQTRNTPKSLLRYTRSVQIVSQFRQVYTPHCAHDDMRDYMEEEEEEGEGEGEEDEEDEPYHAFNRRFTALRALLEGLEDDSLRCFR